MCCSVEGSDCGAEGTAPRWRFPLQLAALFDGFFHYVAGEPVFIEEIRCFHTLHGGVFHLSDIP